MTLAQEVATLNARIESLTLELARARNDVEYYRDQSEKFKRLLFGSKSEKGVRVDVPDEQLGLPFVELAFLDNLPETNKANEKHPKSNTEKNRKPSGNRKKPRLNLETREIIIEPTKEQSEQVKKDGLQIVGYEEEERIDHQRGKFTRLLIKRPVFGKTGHDPNKIIAPSLPAIIPNGGYTDAFIHYIVVEKYFTGLPLYRLSRKFYSQGLPVARSTMCGLIESFSKLYEPIARAMLSQILDSRFMMLDETPVKNQATNKNNYFWVARNYDLCYVHFGESRSTDEALRMLSDYSYEAKVGEVVNLENCFSGYLMSDDYSVYNLVDKCCPLIIHMLCWSHVRRKFFEISAKNEIAQILVGLIKNLYLVETELKNKKRELGWSEEEFYCNRQKYRATISAKIIDELETEMLKHKGKMAPQSPLEKAISYTLDNMDKLRVFLKDGALPIDNNMTEQSIKIVVVGRKNYYFVGNAWFGKWAAVNYSLMETCRLNMVNPYEYLDLATKKLLDGDFKDYFDLTPVALKDQLSQIPLNF